MYPASTRITRVAKKIHKMNKEFQTLCIYDKRKRGCPYNIRILLMMQDMINLFDIFCKDDCQFLPYFVMIKIGSAAPTSNE